MKTSYKTPKGRFLYTGKEIQPLINGLKVGLSFKEEEYKKVYFKLELITNTPWLVDISKCNIIDEITITKLKRKV